MGHESIAEHRTSRRSQLKQARAAGIVRAIVGVVFAAVVVVGLAGCGAAGDPKLNAIRDANRQDALNVGDPAGWPGTTIYSRCGSFNVLGAEFDNCGDTIMRAVPAIPEGTPIAEVCKRLTAWIDRAELSADCTRYLTTHTDMSGPGPWNGKHEFWVSPGGELTVSTGVYDEDDEVVLRSVG